jgi:hypothetical protein
MLKTAAAASPVTLLRNVRYLVILRSLSGQFSAQNRWYRRMSGTAPWSASYVGAHNFPETINAHRKRICQLRNVVFCVLDARTM